MKDAFIVRRGGSGGSGAGGINFDVKAYASEDAIPAEMSLNEIAVITDIEVSSWVVSTIEPDAPIDGMLWIENGSGSEISFNALKKNALIVYPKRAYQYVDGTFSPLDAWLYDGVSRPKFSASTTYLYIEGDTCEGLTGGYYAAGLKPASTSASAAAPTITYGDDAMTIAGSNSYSYNGGYVRTKNKIDLTDFSVLVFEGSRTGSGGAAMHVWTDIGSYINEKSVKSCVISNGDTRAEIDVSGLSGLHYVGFATTKNNDGAATIVVTSLGLE